MIELRSESVDDTRAIAAVIAGQARFGDLIVLAGEMGAGKTAFAQGFARSLGVVEPVTSPTYTLIHTYPSVTGPARIGPSVTPSVAGRCAGPNTNSITIHHADLYRLERTAEVDDLALPELLEDDAVMLVEWGDKVDLGPQLQVEFRPVEFRPVEFRPAAVENDQLEGGHDITDARDITVTSSDKRWDVRWERLAAALQRWAR